MPVSRTERVADIAQLLIPTIRCNRTRRDSCHRAQNAPRRGHHATGPKTGRLSPLRSSFGDNGATVSTTANILPRGSRSRSGFRGGRPRNRRFQTCLALYVSDRSAKHVPNTPSTRIPLRRETGVAGRRAIATHDRPERGTLAHRRRGATIDLQLTAAAACSRLPPCEPLRRVARGDSEIALRARHFTAIRSPGGRNTCIATHDQLLNVRPSNQTASTCPCSDGTQTQETGQDDAPPSGRADSSSTRTRRTSARPVAGSIGTPYVAGAAGTCQIRAVTRDRFGW